MATAAALGDWQVTAQPAARLAIKAQQGCRASLVSLPEGLAQENSPGGLASIPLPCLAQHRAPPSHSHHTHPGGVTIHDKIRYKNPLQKCTPGSSRRDPPSSPAYVGATHGHALLS